MQKLFIFILLISSLKLNAQSIDNLIEIGKYDILIKNHPISIYILSSFPIMYLLVSLAILFVYKKLNFYDYFIFVLFLSSFYLAYKSGINSYAHILDYPIKQPALDALAFHKKISEVLFLYFFLLFIYRNILIFYKSNKMIFLYYLFFIGFISLLSVDFYKGISLVYDYGIGVYYDSL